MKNSRWIATMMGLLLAGGAVACSSSPADDAAAPVAADDEAEIRTRMCGGIAGIQCPTGYECEITARHPDASGKCKKSAPAPKIEDFQDCQKDSDCSRVPAEMCCPNGTFAAIAKSKVSAYQNADWCPQQPTACPRNMRLDQRVAQCNTGKGKCEMIAVADIACGGFTRNPHHCPTGFDCVLSRHVADVPGDCVASAP